MRRTAIALLIIGLATTGLTVTAFAGSLMSETFSYPDGGLVANSGGNWTNHSGATGTDIQIVSGAAVGSMASFPDDNRLFSSPRSATDKTYACFTLTIPNQTMVANYFAHFMVNSTTFRSKVFAAPSQAPGGYLIGVSVTANAAGTPPVIPLAPLGFTWPQPLNFGQAYRVAISYDAANGVSEMWIDPTNEASGKISATDVTAASGALTAFGLRESNSNGCAFTYTVDDLSVGTTFDDACSGTIPVERKTWGTIKTIYR